MPARKELLEVAGREVAVSNPDKIFFPELGLTKIDLVRYYLAVADGALRGIDGVLLPEARAERSSGLDRDGRAEVPERQDRA
jgi:bifunctional non-homologous end joining protein LigD